MCPPPCNTPPPSQCADGDIVCDNGSNAGCWMGDYCMPEGQSVYVEKSRLTIRISLQAPLLPPTLPATGRVQESVLSDG